MVVEAQEVSDMRPRPVGDTGHVCNKTRVFLHVIHSLSEGWVAGRGGLWCLNGEGTIPGGL